MAYLGREAAKAPLVSSDLPDNAVTLAKMTGGTDGQIITYDASGDPVAVGPGTDGQVLTSTGAGQPPAFEDAASSGINSPWEHIGSFSSTSDITNGNIKFQNVFDQYHTVYRLIIPYWGVNDENHNTYLSFMTTPAASKSISAPTWSTTNVSAGSHYRGFSVTEGSDGGSFENPLNYASHNATEIAIYLNSSAGLTANDGFR